MQSFDRDAIYHLTDELLRAIQNKSRDALASFGVTRAIYEEINEELERSGEIVSSLTIPPYELAFSQDSSGRIPFDVYETNSDLKSRRIACQLWAEGKKTDLTLFADFSEDQSKPSLIFRVLETQ